MFISTPIKHIADFLVDFVLCPACTCFFFHIVNARVIKSKINIRKAS